jgi:hypothetical protein
MSGTGRWQAAVLRAATTLPGSFRRDGLSIISSSSAGVNELGESDWALTDEGHSEVVYVYTESRAEGTEGRRKKRKEEKGNDGDDGEDGFG